MKSIRFKTISFLLISLLLINVGFGYYIFHDIKHEIEEVFNAQQAQVARTIEQLIIETPLSSNDDIQTSYVPDISQADHQSTLGHEYEKKIAYQVWGEDGNLLLMSENAPLYPLSATIPGFSRIEYHGDIWHVFSLYSNTSKMWIYTAQKSEARDELISLMTQDQLTSMVLVNIFVLAVVVLGVIVGTRPILILSQEIATRHGTNLAPIDIAISNELLPIKHGINHLLSRINETLNQEKNFNADLSHELRTPLAAIKIHAQNLQLTENLSDNARTSLNSICAGVNNMTQTLEQLLLLSRIESNKHVLMQEAVGLHSLAKEVIAMLPPELHETHSIELQGENRFIQGNYALISVLLRNLIENAIKYGGKAANISVSVNEEENAVKLRVTDSGPGMTDEQKENAVKRHFRGSDRQAYGSGLGLSIVQKITDLHAAELHFLDRPNTPGLIAQITFRASPKQAY